MLTEGGWWECLLLLLLLAIVDSERAQRRRSVWLVELVREKVRVLPPLMLQLSGGECSLIDVPSKRDLASRVSFNCF